MTGAQILVVEDDRLIAWGLANLLSDLGYTPLGPAATGEEAIEMAAHLRPQLVLMDIHLSSAMDGVSAAQALHSQWGIASLFISSLDTPDLRARALLAQPLGFLDKPLNEAQLRAAIEAALARPAA